MELGLNVDKVGVGDSDGLEVTDAASPRYALKAKVLVEPPLLKRRKS